MAEKKTVPDVTPIEDGAKHPPTSYFQTLIHLVKGFVGAGVFAMGHAMKNSGIIVGPVLSIFIAVLCGHVYHIVAECSQKIKDKTGAEEYQDYADTIVTSFEIGHEKFRSISGGVRTAVNTFICIMQLGFCCIYFVFVSTNIQQILEDCGFHVELYWIIMIIYVPICLACLITNLRLLSHVSFFANIFILFGLFVCMYFASEGERTNFDELDNYNTPANTSLASGTIFFAYAAIALILPLKNAMKNPLDFNKPLGVLNVTMVFITILYVVNGVLAYTKWGNDVESTVTLNLGDSIFAQVTKTLVSLGIAFGFPLQCFVAIQIMWPKLLGRSSFLTRRPFTGEILFRGCMVTVCLIIACVVPDLGLFISLVGSIGVTCLGLMIPPIIQLILVDEDTTKTLLIYLWIKNTFIFLFALTELFLGTYECIRQIVVHYADM